MISRRSLRKLAKLSRGEWADLIRAQLALISAQLLVWTRPVGKLIGGAAAPPDAPVAHPRAALSAPTATRQRAAQLALAVSRVAENGPIRPLCLVRAVAINRLLEADGIYGSRIRIGVRMQHGRFAAHAWVEHGDLILGDAPEHVRSFAELTDITVAESP